MAVLIGLFVALFLAIQVGDDAQKHNMNSMLWGFSTFFFSIIAIPLYLHKRKLKLNKGTNHDLVSQSPKDDLDIQS